jgi:hypothetical protein
VKPGAWLLADQGTYGTGSNIDISQQYGVITWGGKIAFVNPNGEKVIIVRNSKTTAVTTTVRVGNLKFKPTLPANSISTFVMGKATGIAFRGNGERSVPPQPLTGSQTFEIYNAAGKRIAAATGRHIADLLAGRNGSAGNGVYIITSGNRSPAIRVVSRSY